MTETMQETQNPVQAAAEVQYEDYWGTQEEHKFFLPDGKQHFTVVPLNEGGKTRFQKLTNKGIRMNQKSQEAHLDVDPAAERHTLIKESVTSWLIMQRSPDGTFSPFPCSENESQRKRSLEVLLEKFNPKVVQDLEFFIRSKNPWMQDDMEVEQIDEEIDRLNDLRKAAIERKAGEASSANK